LLLAIAAATAADMCGTRSREWQMLLALHLLLKRHNHTWFCY